MVSDKALGVLIVIGIIVVAILYFGSFIIPWWTFLSAVKVVVSIGFLLVLGIGGWIGWTMASTPSPEPVEDLDMEELDIEDTEEGSEPVEEQPEV